eukprot:61049-Pelagomonas_calceolata.AAC.1
MRRALKPRTTSPVPERASASKSFHACACLHSRDGAGGIQGKPSTKGKREYSFKPAPRRLAVDTEVFQYLLKRGCVEHRAAHDSEGGLQKSECDVEWRQH